MKANYGELMTEKCHVNVKFSEDGNYTVVT